MKNTEKIRNSALSAVLSLALAGSYALPFTAGAENIAGDVNLDGAVTAADMVAMSQYLLGKLELEEKFKANMDINSDGKVNIVDYVMLANMLIEGNSTAPDDPQPGDVSEEKTITLEGDSVKVTGTGAAVSGSTVTITEPGTYSVKGKLSDGQIIVDVDKEKYPEEKVELSLEGAEITCLSNSPVYIASVGDECVITVKKGTENIITDGKDYKNADEDAGAIYSKDDLKIKGKGSLTVNGNCADGIVSNDSVKIFNGNITVNAADDGIRGKDSVKIGDSDDADHSNLSVTVKTAAGDGIKSTSTKEGKGKVIINGGTVTLETYADGIQAEQNVDIKGGELIIKTYQGSSFTGTATGGNTGGWGGMGMDGNANKTDISAKGIKAVGLYDEAGTTYQSAGDINISGGTITIDSSDDSIHAAGNANITGGRLNLSSADDAVHADHDVIIGQGTATTFDDVLIYVPKCYEGIEGQNITQNSGTCIVYSDDDGYNAAGGSDGSGNANPGGWNPGGWGGGMSGGGNYSITLKGGLAYVSAADGDHDGFDSNGSITIDGAIAISNGNEAFDCDGTKTFSSGTFVELSGSGSGGFGGGFGGGRPGGPGGMGGSSGMTASFTSTISAKAGDRITVSDSSGNVIVSFIAVKAATSCSVGNKNVSSGTVKVGGDVNNGTALPVIGNSQQIYVGK